LGDEWSSGVIYFIGIETGSDGTILISTVYVFCKG